MNVNLAICLPFSGRFVPPEWAVSLATLYPPMNCNHSIIVCKGVQRDIARNGLVKKALAIGVKYILFLDDDTAPPPYAIQRLMYYLDNSGDDVAVCAGVYVTKTDPPMPTILMEEGTGPFWRWKLGDVFPCAAIGTGCMMIRASVFEKISEPWFVDVNHPDQARELGLLTEDNSKDLGSIDRFAMTDDVFFCRKVREAGFKVMAHGGVIAKHFDENGRAYELPPDCYPVRAERRESKTDSVEIRALKGRYPFPEEDPQVRVEVFSDADWWGPQVEEGLRSLVPKDAKVIVELGSWVGHGAVRLAAMAPEATIVCIDHWLGSPEHRSDPAMRQHLPKLYRAFVTNVWPQRERFVPMKTTTLAGMQELADMGIKPDLIYVDASHDYADVKEDVRLAKELFPDAILCGDDYDWPDVRGAVKDQLGNRLEHNGRCWWAATEAVAEEVA